MTDRIYKILGISGIFLMFVFFVSGCATAPGKEELEGLLKTTADSYWKLRMEDKYEDSYKMENKQGLPPFEEYRGRAMTMKRIRITSISVKSVSVSDDKGVVELEYSYLLPKISQPFHQILTDYWGYNNGTWRHEFK